MSQLHSRARPLLKGIISERDLHLTRRQATFDPVRPEDDVDDVADAGLRDRVPAILHDPGVVRRQRHMACNRQESGALRADLVFVLASDEYRLLARELPGRSPLEANAERLLANTDVNDVLGLQLAADALLAHDRARVVADASKTGVRFGKQLAEPLDGSRRLRGHPARRCQQPEDAHGYSRAGKTRCGIEHDRYVLRDCSGTWHGHKPCAPDAQSVHLCAVLVPQWRPASSGGEAIGCATGLGFGADEL